MITVRVLEILWVLDECGPVRRVQPGQLRGESGPRRCFWRSDRRLTAKYWYSEMGAIDATAGWHFGDDDEFQMNADHLWNFYVPALKPPEGRLPLYAGLAGIRNAQGTIWKAGIHCALGAAYLFDKAPLELFAEIAPILEFAPDTDGSVEGGVGIRFYFK